MKLTYGNQTLYILQVLLITGFTIFVWWFRFSFTLLYLICLSSFLIQRLYLIQDKMLQLLWIMSALKIYLQLYERNISYCKLLRDHDVYPFDIMDPEWREYAASKREDRKGNSYADGTKIATVLNSLVLLKY